jgi:hypothetical protein
VRHRDAQPRAAQADGEGRLGALHLDEHVLADEVERGVAEQRAGQEPRLAQDLEAVADADHRAAAAGVADDVLHHRREARQRAAAQVIAVGEAAREHHRVEPRRQPVLVPHVLRVGAADVLHHVVQVVVAVRAGEGDDADLHELFTAGASSKR